METLPRIRLAGSFAELERWGSAYDRFLDQLGDYALFYRTGWLRSIWPIFSQQPGSLYFLSAWEDEALIGLAPFQLLRKGPMQGWRRVLHFIGTHHPTVANRWPDFLMSREDRRVMCLKAFAQALRERRAQWDAIELLNLAEDSPNLPLLGDIWPDATFSDDCKHSAQAWIETDFDAYFAGFSRSTRKDLLKNRRRLETNEPDVVFHSTEHMTPERWSAVARMHRDRQEKLRAQGRDRQSLFDHPVEAEALQHALTWAEQSGHARYHWLDIQGTPAAFAIGCHSGQTYNSFIIGMDERAEPYYGGMLLQLYVIEAEARHFGTRCIDLGLGMDFNKRRFGTREQRHCHVLKPNRHNVLSVTRNHWVRFAKSFRSPPQMAEGTGR